MRSHGCAVCLRVVVFQVLFPAWQEHYFADEYRASFSGRPQKQGESRRFSFGDRSMPRRKIGVETVRRTMHSERIRSAFHASAEVEAVCTATQPCALTKLNGKYKSHLTSESEEHLDAFLVISFIKNDVNYECIGCT
jgi:hypothetical protein